MGFDGELTWLLQTYDYNQLICLSASYLGINHAFSCQAADNSYRSLTPSSFVAFITEETSVLLGAMGDLFCDINKLYGFVKLLQGEQIHHNFIMDPIHGLSLHRLGIEMDDGALKYHQFTIPFSNHYSFLPIRKRIPSCLDKYLSSFIYLLFQSSLRYS